MPQGYYELGGMTIDQAMLELQRIKTLFQALNS